MEASDKATIDSEEAKELFEKQLEDLICADDSLYFLKKYFEDIHVCVQIQKKNPLSLDDGVNPISEVTMVPKLFDYKADDKKRTSEEWISKVENLLINKKDISKQNIISKKNQRVHDNDPKSVEEYDVIWFAYWKQNSLKRRILADVLLEILHKDTEKSKNLDILSQKTDIIWEQRLETLQFDLVKWYVQSVFQTGIIPPETVMRQVAFHHYEKQENHSAFYLISEDIISNINKKEMVSFDSSHVIKMEADTQENIALVRKMLETCRGDERCLLVNDKSPYEIIGIARTETIVKHANCSTLCVKFQGYGGWTLHHVSSKEQVLIYKEGAYCIDDEQERNKWDSCLDKIDKIKDNLQLFRELLDTISKCPHGALMIAGTEDDMLMEIGRLCIDCDRGKAIAPLDLSIESNRTLLEGMASVDGAVLVGYDGKCYGFGVILDGKAKKVGKMGRGARYNSAVTYVENTDRAAFIHSEDKEKPMQIIYKNDIYLV